MLNEEIKCWEKKKMKSDDANAERKNKCEKVDDEGQTLNRVKKKKLFLLF